MNFSGVDFWNCNYKEYQTHVIFRMIWYHLHNLKNMKNTHEQMLLLLKLQALACNFTKSNIPPWVFFTFFKLYKWCQIAQSISYTKIFIHSMLIISSLYQKYGKIPWNM